MKFVSSNKLTNKNFVLRSLEFDFDPSYFPSFKEIKFAFPFEQQGENLMRGEAKMAFFNEIIQILIRKNGSKAIVELHFDQEQLMSQYAEILSLVCVLLGIFNK